MGRVAVIVAAIAAFLSSPAGAGVGTAGAATLEQPVAARPVALAEAYSAGAEGADSLGYNPAGLALMRERELLLQYHGGFAGDMLVSGVFGLPVAGFLGLAGGVVSYDSGSVERVAANGTTVSAGGQRDIMALAGFGVRVKGTGLAVGAAGRYLRTELFEDYSGNVIAVDAGIRWDVPWDVPSTGLSLGACVQNIGGPVTLEANIPGEEYESAWKGKVVAIELEGERLPCTVRTGFSLRYDIEDWSAPFAAFEGVSESSSREKAVPGRFTFLGDSIWRVGEGLLALAGGGEILFAGVFAVRAGYRSFVYGYPAKCGVMCLGAGLRAPLVRLDYAVELPGGLALHRTSISLVF